ncbi:MAG: NACHT domain-containing protein [Anaerolineales bacterium]|nr:NACHT domain-containing protein [Anaerolineales bacterium]
MVFSSTTDLPYDPEKFVNRAEELKIVRERVLACQRNEVVDQSLISFWGVADIGKSWLLKHIEHLYAYKEPERDSLRKPTLPLYHEFREEEQSLTAVSQSLVHYLAAHLPANLSQPEAAPPPTFAGDPTEALVAYLKRLAERVVILLLFDTTEYVDDTLWDTMETSLLEPLLKSDKVLVIVTGRNRAPRWKRVEVRRRAMPTEKSEVRPFTTEATQEQLQRLGLPQAAKQANLLMQDSLGTPGLSARLGRSWQQLSEEQYKQERIETWKQYIDDIFGHLSPTWQQMIEAVVPLRYYRTQALRLMLTQSAYEVEDDSDVFLLRVLRKLDKQTHLVWWDNSQNAYVTAVVARWILNRQLQVCQPTKFIDQHTLALNMYKNWAQEFPNSLPAYIPELLFHESTLARAQEQNPDETIDQTAFEKMISQLSIDNQDILQRRLENDTELKALMPTLFKNLLDFIDSSVNQNQ